MYIADTHPLITFFGDPQDLHDQHAKRDASHKDQIESLQAQHEQYVLGVMANDALALTAATTALTEEFDDKLRKQKDVSDRHLVALRAAEERVKVLERELPVAVQEAKRRVYDKAQAQFAVGNKEYQKMKRSLLEAVAANEERDQKMSALDVALQQASADIDRLQVEKTNIQADMTALTNQLRDMVAAEYNSGVVGDTHTFSPFDAIAAVIRYYRDKNGEYAQQLSKAQGEKSAHEAAVKDLASQLSEARAAEQNLKQVLTNVESRLKIATDSLQSSNKENQNQLLLTSRVISDKVRLEKELSATKEELQSTVQRQAETMSELSVAVAKVVELTKRCDELRAMNEEVIGMLEARYTQDGERAL